jgi:hypothetical protein
MEISSGVTQNQQKPHIQLTLLVYQSYQQLDPNGNTYNIGNVTTDVNGTATKCTLQMFRACKRYSLLSMAQNLTGHHTQKPPLLLLKLLNPLRRQCCTRITA